jgi:hypothetical protein
MSILNINDLALQLVALDFSDGHMPTNGGPTKTSRALAIIHLAAHDAYAQVSAQAIEENDISRIYLGVHWLFDAEGGNKVGTAIADKVFEAFQ